MSKLCILGEEVEPCFEGAGISKVEFSFDEGFKKELFSFMKLMQEKLKEGGAPVFNRYAVEIGDSLWTALYSNMDYETYSIDGIYDNVTKVLSLIYPKIFEYKPKNCCEKLKYVFHNKCQYIPNQFQVLTILKSDENNFNNLIKI